MEEQEPKKKPLKRQRQEVIAAPPKVYKNGRSNINSWVKRCGAPKRGGGYCGRVMMKNGKGCSWHGGKAKKGMESGQYKTGRYTKALKDSKLLERYERAKLDPSLLELNEEIALTQALIEEILTRIDTGEGRATLTSIEKKYDSMMDTLAMGNMDLFNRKMEELGGLIHSASSQFSVIEDFKSAIRLKKDLSESQSKREIQLDQQMKAEDVLILVQIIFNEIRNVMYDRITDKQFAAELLSESWSKASKHLGGPNRGNTYAALPES